MSLTGVCRLSSSLLRLKTPHSASIHRSLGPSLFRALQSSSICRSSMSTVAEKFSKEGVVPDVVPTAPGNAAKVVYPAGEVDFGNTMTPTQVQDPPTTISYPVDAGALYTLIMTDPDAPSRKDPKFREWRHWLVVNIPGCEVSKGEEVAAYIGAGPPENTGLHRYVFLVYKQADRITFTDPKLGLSTANRGGTKTADLTSKYNLGNPVAGNLFQAEWDDYVPKLYQKLGD